jgi:hypothetical protein
MPDVLPNPSNAHRWIAPQRIDLSLSVLDCSSRLVSTARSRVYDKIRRHVSTVPVRIRDFLREAGVPPPRIHLNLIGLREALSGLTASEFLSVCLAAEQGALDEGVDLIRLGEIDVAGGATDESDISMIPDLLGQCVFSELNLNLASSLHGGNARDIYATALVLLLDQFTPEASARLILSANSTLSALPMPISLDELNLESVNSVWPMMSSMRGELPVDACYTDTSIALSFIGTRLTEGSIALQSDLVASLQSADINISGRTVKLTIDAPGEGPLPAGVWCGLPLAAYAGAASGKAAASLLGQRLTSSPSASRRPVESDNLPLSDSIRNFHAVSVQTLPADLAGALVRELTRVAALEGHKYFRIVRVNESPSAQGVSLDFVNGTVPFLPIETGWSPDHFSKGGLIISPSRAW